jgi:hypothetical protein
MAEMILPGTYIEVRAEGLIVPGPITVSNVAVVGTARRGELNRVYTPSDIGEARDLFGQYDALDNPDETGAPLTLVRALELAYANGAQRVYAVRVARTAGASAGVTAVYTFAADTGNVTAESVAPGSGYNGAELKTETGTAGLNVTFTLGRLRETWRDVPAAVAEFAQVINGTHPTYPYATKSSNRGGSDLFRLDATGATGNVAEGTATPSTPGTNGAQTVAADYTAGLDALVNENVHIIVLAGQTAATLGAALTAHCENASTDAIKRDRIGIIGGDSDALADLTNHGMDSSRIVFCGPGIRVNDAVKGAEVPLDGTYTAAAVAGVISSLEPHFSPTNKPLRVNSVATKFNGTQLEQLVLARVLALEDRQGATKIVQGITTSSDTAWKQITTRRIVDYAKFGVRSACEPFIGKLNNERVRQAMKGTINSFLADMVDREMLISYDVDVSATREQQIRGIAVVTMILRPTFSIDYIRVVMYLE